MDSPPAREWERHVFEFLTGDVPDEVIDRAVLTVADILTAAVAGSAVDTIDRVGLDADFGDGPASIIGSDRRVNVGQATLVNTAASIAQEIEEGHNAGGHVGASIVAGGFAVAEKYDVDGLTFLTAVVKAYEVCARLEYAILAMKDQLNDELPWKLHNPHSTWTPLGPALAAGLCMGLDQDRLEEVFRVAANLTVLSMFDPFPDGAPSRNFTAGFSAQVGVEAALAAAAGLDGSALAMREVYDPVRELRGGSFDRSFAELGETWEISRNYFKLSPSCRYTHPPLDALRDITDEVVVDEIERIDVYSYRNALDLNHTDVSTFTSAKFSIPFLLARYLTSGEIWFDDFDEEAFADEAVAALAEKVTLHYDQAYEEAFPAHWSARVEVTHADGRTVSGECVDPPGDYRRHPDPETLTTKFRDVLRWRFDDTRADAALDALLNLADRDVRAVGASLRGVDPA